MNSVFLKSNTIKMLEILIEQQINVNFDVGVFCGLTSEEVNIFLCIMAMSGAVKIDNDKLRIPSKTANLFMKSILEFVKEGKEIIKAWDDDSSVSDKITGNNALAAINLLYLLEDYRRTDKAKINPIKEETICRVVLKRKSWGKEYVLMQYDSRVRHYQLIGGIRKASEEKHKETLERKISGELSGLPLNSYSHKYTMLYESKHEEEEIILSKKFGVNAKYKTYLYTIDFDEKLGKDVLKEIGTNPDNRWISYKEIEKNKANDGRDIFKLPPRAIDSIKRCNRAVLWETYSLHDILNLSVGELLSCFLKFLRLFSN